MEDKNTLRPTQTAKFITREVRKASVKADLAYCQRLMRGCVDSIHDAEGRKAFMEKCTPLFKGIGVLGLNKEPT